MDKVCPICHEESVHTQSVSNWGEMRRCLSCKLVFASPMMLPEPPESLFNKAYQGLAENPGMKEYRQRIALKEEMKKGNIDPGKTLFWGAYDEAMAWLKANVSPGSVVLDIGCGVGYFLSALRRGGFIPIGLDVAKQVVDMLRDDGFEMWHGTVDSVPPGWKQPVVCSSFFVIHHLPDPVGFLATIRSKFPKATLLIAAWNQYPSPQRLSAASLPPRTLAWWGPQALQKAMEKAGYQVDFVSQPIGAAEFEMPRMVRRLFSHDSRSSWHYRLLSIYYDVKPVIFWPWRLWRRSAGKSATILAIGKPS